MEEKENQIEEMAKVIDQAKYDMWVGKVHQSGDFTNHSKNIAKALYANGYRKGAAIVEEIEKYILEGATTIESNNSDSLYGAKFAIEKVVLPILEAYKNKYTEDRE